MIGWTFDLLDGSDLPGPGSDPSLAAWRRMRDEIVRQRRLDANAHVMAWVEATGQGERYWRWLTRAVREAREQWVETLPPAAPLPAAEIESRRRAAARRRDRDAKARAENRVWVAEWELALAHEAAEGLAPPR